MNFDFLINHDPLSFYFVIVGCAAHGALIGKFIEKRWLYKKDPNIKIMEDELKKAKEKALGGSGKKSRPNNWRNK